MQSTASNVTAYLEEVPQKRKECLTALRNLCLDTLTGYEESMDFNVVKKLLVDTLNSEDQIC